MTDETHKDLKNDKETIFKKIEQERGMVSRIYSDFSDFPESVEAHFNLNKALILSETAPLPRAERELLAYVTSDANGNIYCSSHHQKAFENYESDVDPQRVTMLKNLAESLTKAPQEAHNLRATFLSNGFTQAEWQHAVNIIAYFNFTNRLAFAMNLQLEEGFEKSCN